MSQLTNYIQKELDKGFSKDIITKRLLQAGYTQQEIAESINSLKSVEPLLRRKLADTIHEDAKVIRSKWLFPAIGIFLLIVFVYLIFQYVNINVPTTPVEAELETSCEDSNSCKDPEQGCEYAEDYTQCITELALKEKNAELCGKRIECVTALAIELNDGSLCYYLVRGKEYCTSEYYTATGDAQYCTAGNLECGYKPEASEQEKLEFFEQNIDAIDKDYLNDYAMEFAIENNEYLICQYLQETDEKIQDILDENMITMPDFCIIAIAHNSENSAICEMLTETHKYSFCIETLNCTEGRLCNEIE